MWWSQCEWCLNLLVEAHSVGGSGGGEGKKGSWCKFWVSVMNIEYKWLGEVDTTPVDARLIWTKSRVNNVRLLCSFALSVPCWIFVCASFLKIRNLRTRGNYRRMHLVCDLDKSYIITSSHNAQYIELSSSTIVVLQVAESDKWILPLFTGVLGGHMVPTHTSCSWQGLVADIY